MASQLTKCMREKYRAKQIGSSIFDRRPAGGNDVVLLCDAVDRLESLVRDLQRRTENADEQNRIERELWAALS